MDDPGVTAAFTGWAMSVYFGEYHVSLDERGRFPVPMDLRKLMQERGDLSWAVARGFDDALFVYPEPKYREVMGRLTDGAMDPEVLAFLRHFGAASFTQLDTQGRLLVGSSLRDYAGFLREAILIGVGETLELWSVSGWRKYQQDQKDNYKAVAAGLFGRRVSGCGQRTEEGSTGC